MRELIDEDGENRAVRCFLGMYQCGGAVSVKAMKIHLEHSGFNDCWPAWVTVPTNEGHLTKGGAQDWLRHLFSLESAATPPAAPPITDTDIDACIWHLRGEPAAFALARRLIRKSLLSQSPAPETVRDAERYRFLRREWRNISIGFDGPRVDALSMETRENVRCHMTDIAGFNAVIDAAIATAKEGSAQ